jgi:hypothetical protein
MDFKLDIVITQVASDYLTKLSLRPLGTDYDSLKFSTSLKLAQREFKILEGHILTG